MTGELRGRPGGVPQRALGRVTHALGRLPRPRSHAYSLQRHHLCIPWLNFPSAFDEDRSDLEAIPRFAPENTA